jgi:hypothetical protein
MLQNLFIFLCFTAFTFGLDGDNSTETNETISLPPQEKPNIIELGKETNKKIKNDNNFQ